MWFYYAGLFGCVAKLVAGIFELDFRILAEYSEVSLLSNPTEVIAGCELYGPLRNSD